MLIIVAGLPGCGKSYFAERLAQTLGADYINSDRLRVSMGATGRYSDDEKFGIYKEMLLRASQALSRRKSVVVDATFFHHTLREMFLRLARGYGEPVRLIEVIADENLIRDRLSHRRPYSEADFAVYEKVRDAFEEINMPHLTIQSTNENVDEMLKQSLEYIESGIARSS